MPKWRKTQPKPDSRNAEFNENVTIKQPTPEQVAAYRKQRIGLIVTFCVLGAVFLFSAGQIVADKISVWRADQLYSNMPYATVTYTLRPPATPYRTLAPDETPAPTATPYPITAPETGYLEGLKAINPEVVGIIEIPGTSIHYPIVRGADNDYYLNHTFDKKYNTAGAIYMDFRNDPLFLDQHTIIYGHHRYSKQMFNELDQFLSKSFVSKNRTILITLDDRIIQGTIFAVCRVDADLDYRATYYAPQEGFEAFLDQIMAYDEADLGLRPVYGQRVLSLTTCNYTFDDARLVIMAVLDDLSFQQPWQQQEGQPNRYPVGWLETQPTLPPQSYRSPSPKAKAASISG